MLKLPPSQAAQYATRGRRTAALGLITNAALAIIKGVAGVVGNSYALVADAVESTLDLVSSAIVWSGLRIAAVPPDANHPYGHGKAEPLAGAVVSIILLGVAVSLAVGSIHSIFAPVNEPPAPFTLVVLVMVVAVKEALARFVLNVGKELRSTAVKSDAWHHRSDALTSLAAFIGISVALIGGEGYEDADAWAALFACAIIAYNGLRLLWPALGEMMDVAPDPSIEEGVRESASQVEGVFELETCVVRKMGFDYFVDLHVEVDPHIPVHEGHEIAHRVKDAVRENDPRIRDVLIHIEPAGGVPDPSIHLD